MRTDENHRTSEGDDAVAQRAIEAGRIWGRYRPQERRPAREPKTDAR